MTYKHTNFENSTKCDTIFRIPNSAYNYLGYIDALYEAKDSLSEKAFIEGIKTVSDAMKNDIINAKDEITVSGKKYYISNNGDDSNDGRSPETAWATIGRLNEMTDIIKAGDAVLFERGGEWRIVSGSIVQTKEGVSYGAYGIGRKPVLNGSARNYADENFWSETEYENVYVCSFDFDNAGIAVVDFTGKAGNYNEKVIQKRIIGLGGFEGLPDLKDDCTYFGDLKTKKLYFCSKEGNPGLRFSSIEIGGRNSAFYNKNANIIDNFEIRFAGYGVIGGTKMNVKNCIFDYIGGCQLCCGETEPVVCGNAVEICGCCDGFYVENCWMYQICDSGISHQQWEKIGRCEHKNIKYTGNVVEYCYWSIEFNNIKTVDGSYRKVENFNHSYNVLSMGGYGFGGYHFYREKASTLYNCFGIPLLENGVCKKNILNRCCGSLYRISSEADKGIAFSKNINVQENDGKLGFMFYKYDLEYNDEDIDKFDEVCAQNDSVYLSI